MSSKMHLQASFRLVHTSMMWLVAHAQRVIILQKSLGVAQPEEEAVLKDINARLSSHLLPHKDSNGFRKLILILSASGSMSSFYYFASKPRCLSAVHNTYNGYVWNDTSFLLNA